jgi:hypothetical protein
VTAVRWLARAAACLVLLLAMVTAVFWTWMGPQGSWTLAWLAAMFVTITGAVWGLVALQPESGSDGGYPEDWREQGWCCRRCAVLAWYSVNLELRGEFTADEDVMFVEPGGGAGLDSRDW